MKSLLKIARIGAAYTAFGALFLNVIHAAEWYVSGAGNDDQNGTSPTTAFRSLQKAADLVNPGDTVHVGDGIYTNEDRFSDSAVVRMNRSGKPDAWITWKADPGTHPDLHPIGWNGLLITSSYNIIDGLSVTGMNDSIFLAEALADAKISEKDGAKYPGDPKYNANGIFITGRRNAPDAKPHHNIIRNCTVSKMPGAGIVGIETDYLTIEDNVVFENAWFMRYGGSGISTLTNWAHDDAPGYHNIFQRNRVWYNRTFVPWEVVARLSDGNGIILDVSDEEKDGAANPDAAPKVKGPAKPGATPTPAVFTSPTPTTAPAPKSPRPIWKNRSLVANNICAFNGGSGIHTFRTKHVDIINNTTYWNGFNVGYPDLFANSSEDIVILNNIIVPRPGGKVTSNNKNANNRWDYNLYSVPQSVLTGPHDIVADPQFIKIARDLRDADFHLQPGSPALNSATDELAQDKDLLGQPRPVGKGRDLGAFEQ